MEVEAGLDCVGKPITAFIGLTNELHKEIIRTGPAGNPMTMEEEMIVRRYWEVATGNGTTYLAPTRELFFSARSHFKGAVWLFRVSHKSPLKAGSFNFLARALFEQLVSVLMDT